MSIDSTITVSGWVGTQPRHVVTQHGTSFTVFRMGSTKRYFDRSQEAWVDGATTWFTVKTWRTTAVNVAESLRRSDPVVVHGALSTEVWESPDGPRTTLVIEADALGPDLTRGQATFRHTVHHPGLEAGGPPRSESAGANGSSGASGSSGTESSGGPGAPGTPDSSGEPGEPGRSGGSGELGRSGDGVPRDGVPRDVVPPDGGATGALGTQGRGSGVGVPGDVLDPQARSLTEPADDDPWQVARTGGPPETRDPEAFETVPAMSA